MDVLKRKSEILKAISQPTRLRILEILREGERCVCDMIPQLGEEQANVSKHLSILRQAGLVDFRKNGVSSFYRTRYGEIYKIIDLAEEIVKKEVLKTAELVKEMGLKR